MIVSIAKEIRLANNYTLTENLEKLGSSELPSFDLFRKEKAKTKRFRQRLIEKLEVIMGNDAAYENNLVNDKKHLNPIVDVEIDGLDLSSFKLPLNMVQPQNINENLVDLNTLMTKDLKNSLDVESNPMALALLGVSESSEGDLTKLISDSPLTVLDQWVNQDQKLPQLGNVKVGDLKDVFFNFLQKRNICVTDVINEEDFIEMQLKQGLADILLKESFNEQDMIKYLSNTGNKGIKKELILEGFENVTRSDKNEELEDKNKITEIRNDLQTLTNLAKEKRFEVSFDIMEKLLNQVDTKLEMYLVREKLEKLDINFNNPPEEYQEFFNKKMINPKFSFEFETIEPKNTIDHDYVGPFTKVTNNDNENNNTMIQEIEKFEKYEESEDKEYKLYDNKEEVDELKKTLFEEEMLLLRDFKQKKQNGNQNEEVEVMPEQPENILNHVTVSKPILKKMVEIGFFKGIKSDDQKKIYEALEIQRLARETSNSRMKQYLMMFKIAETPLEQEFCLQKLRKELFSFGEFNPEILDRSNLKKPFEIFIDSLAKEIEGQVKEDESSEMSKVVSQILNKNFVSSEIKVNFKKFLEKQVKKNNKGKRILNSKTLYNEDDSENLVLSGKTLNSLVQSSKTANIDVFLRKLKTAFLGNWEDKSIYIFYFNLKILLQMKFLN